MKKRDSDILFAGILLGLASQVMYDMTLDVVHDLLPDYFPSNWPKLIALVGAIALLFLVRFLNRLSANKERGKDT